ncbi:MAG TPA: UDP-N-acetylmuramoyl-tripeptide--D-alanyl-D-alanine ligase [Blastocatellia bacterium]|jgi:UDP-N-acetylmuramoyl-tripeptide--D-alanyl-D-alanine ligase|nr:UDP-N-acetylmuramoyl-tripeptide--D-alanyl-D-alanine ligase [Blastocatellia bacterium]
MLNERLAETEPAGFALDSRAIKAGELFVAIPGERVDGHQFVREVFEKGACAAMVVHHRLPFAADLGDYAGRLLFVENTVCAFQGLARRVVAEWHRPVVGVTASAGKTTMKDLIAHCLGAGGNVLKSSGNLNTGYGLPLVLARMIIEGAKPSNYDFAVLEMGMSSFGEIARLVSIAAPEVGVVGNVGTAHIEFFGSQERIARAKAEMVDGVKQGGAAVLNADDPLVIGMRERRDDIAVISFGVSASASVTAREIAVAPGGGSRFILQTPDGDAEVKMPLIGRHNVYNALAAAAVASYFGFAPEQIASRLATSEPSKMRGELIRFANGVTVIDDSYNSNPQALLQSVRAMLDVANSVASGRRVVVAGEMLELGDHGPDLHRKCGREIAAMGIDVLIGVRGLASELVAGAVETSGSAARLTSFCETPEEAAEMLVAGAVPGDVILVKGSRGVRMEIVVERLKAAFGSSKT